MKKFIQQSISLSGLATLILITLFSIKAHSQSFVLDVPNESQEATVMQTIGLTNITVNYHSPAVKGRQVWDGIVPYGQLWRCGANENTLISFTHDVKIEGKEIKAGTYGLHMIPNKEEWTIIFSSNTTSWGSFFYRPAEDVLRVNVKPEQMNESREWLTYEFFNREQQSATLALIWEKIKVPVKIEVDVHKIVIASLKDQLRGTEGFTWRGWNDAAAYCLQNNVEIEQGLTWIEVSIRSEANFTNMRTKAGLLRLAGKQEEADKIMKEAMPLASENELNAYGYQLMQAGDIDGAMEVFATNVKQHPKSWNVYDSYAEALAAKGDKKNAVKNYKKAKSLTKDEAQIKRIDGEIKKLEA